MSEHKNREAFEAWKKHQLETVGVYDSFDAFCAGMELEQKQRCENIELPPMPKHTDSVTGKEFDRRVVE